MTDELVDGGGVNAKKIRKKGIDLEEMRNGSDVSLQFFLILWDPLMNSRVNSKHY